ncbi:MAG: lipopolysaccharide biosynthesis protein [Candidatus Methylomirabilis sp.]|nr:lipopolysaccharide biosynthesis protein [Deltaproteobacteria bacterium]
MQIVRRLKALSEFLSSHDGNLQKKTVRSGVLVGFNSVIINSLGFIRTIILARLLAPEVFGLMSICLIVVKAAEIFTETGFGAALIHRKDHFEASRDTAFTMSIIRGCVLAISVFFLSPLIAAYYDNILLEDLIKVAALILFFHGTQNINIIAFQKELDFRRIAVLELTRAASAFLLLVGLAYYLGNIWSLVIGYVAVAAVDSVLTYIIIPGRPRIRFKLSTARELFAYGKYITGLSIVVFIAAELDNLVIGKVLGMEMLGFYVIAFTLANLPTTHISKVTSRVMFPSYSKLQDDPHALREAYLKVLKLVASISIPAGAGLAVLSLEIVSVLYGERWAYSAGPLRILCVYGCIMAIMSLNGYIFNAIGKPNIPFYFNAARLVLIAILIYPMTAWLGLYGAAIAVTLPLALQFASITFVFARTLGLEVMRIVKILSYVLFSTLVMILVLMLYRKVVHHADIYTLALGIAIGISTYAALNARDLRSIFARRILNH